MELQRERLAPDLSAAASFSPEKGENNRREMGKRQMQKVKLRSEGNREWVRNKSYGGGCSACFIQGGCIRDKDGRRSKLLEAKIICRIN